ncbi:MULTISPECIES: response regulator [Streptomycetaceae]|uniref:Response regulator containing a CheY-like receiver domain and an HTH DNA-binding domain n=1 Tax=Streptantibioticus cattleyicolor (strain ATCC 35852 / DSM 46488 / JCM 4925 / NBRC 14057 / NRRL 8057) TaxID=1003195 RepID=G8X147_STREN|nr:MULTISPECIES: response regulator transcription factor [Streptomycetaceae]AEW97915.1 response regulator containing a CheY-like receiver domain and an HTH DNA-binding domain [Streptantibioticus cattleyicolor NRRL 8057 = DSM 46488]MYS62321.1 response regulator [Streptomyces sp. SID5468]
MIRVLLVDDDPLVRAGLTMMLRGAADIEVVGEVADGAGVAGAVRRHTPDVVLMDIRMPVMDGIAATRTVAGGDRTPKVIVLTTFDTGGTVLAAMRAGAAGYLLKHTEPDEIVDAVRRAARDEPVLSPAAARTLIDHAAAGTGTRTERARRKLAGLSDRERQIARAVADGLSNSEIGDRLHLSTGTVKAHLSSALTKLDLDNRVQLALLAHDAEAE